MGQTAGHRQGEGGGTGESEIIRDLLDPDGALSLHKALLFDVMKVE